MEIQSHGTAPTTSAKSAPGRGAVEKCPAEPRDSFDYTDGANHPLEIALLPSTDLVLGQVVGDALQSGKKVMVEGEITDSQNPQYRETIDVRMELDGSSGELVTRAKYGPYECWTDPATIVSEKGRASGTSFDFIITGYVGNRAAENPPNNEELVVSAGMGVIGLKGSVDGFPVEGMVSVNPFTASVNHDGNVAGTKFARKITPSGENSVKIEGTFGELKEEGKISADCEGNIVIDRTIGSFHVKEKVTFS